MIRRRLIVLAAALFAAAGVANVPAPARAAACAAGTGVSVVVEFGSLGGGTTTACVTDGAGDAAWDVVERAGFDLTGTQRFPGFVCRVSGKPADDPCVNTPPDDAYWGLFWSKGDGKWIYSSQGAKALEVPRGGWIGLAFQTGSRNLPDVTPGSVAKPTPTKAPSPTSRPTPTKRATPSATSAPAASATESASAATTASASGSASPSVTKKSSASRSAAASVGVPPSQSPSGGDLAAAEPVSTHAEDDRGGVGWLLPLVIVVALLGAAGVLGLRRRSAHHRAEH